MLVKFKKYLIKVCDTFLLSFIFTWFPWRMIGFAVLLLLEKEGLSVIQNFLVSVILLEFKLLQHCLFGWFRALAHYFLCFLYFCQSSLMRDLLNLWRTLSRFFKGFLTWKGSCYIWSFYKYREHIYLLLTKISHEILQIASQVVKSCFEGLC